MVGLCYMSQVISYQWIWFRSVYLEPKVASIVNKEVINGIVSIVIGYETLVVGDAGLALRFLILQSHRNIDNIVPV